MKAAGTQYKFLRQSPNDGMSMQGVRTEPKRLYKLDFWLTILLVILATVGLINLYSASQQDLGTVYKQLISFVLAFIMMFVVAQIPPKIYQALSPWAYAFSLSMLVLVMLVGDIRLGAQRWLSIPLIGSVQPSEMSKIATPMMVAWFLADRSIPPSFKQVIIALVITAVPFLMIAEQPDLGTGMLVLSAGVYVIFVSGLSWKIIALFGGAFLAIVPLAWEFLLHDYQRQRVLTLLDPSKDALGTGWNILQSTAAIGSGGFSGKGYLHGTQSHLNFLPEAHTDFAIAAFSEEFGLVGVILLILLYTAIVLRIVQIAIKTKNTYQRLLVTSIAMSFGTYVFINMGMVAGILPIVGVPLPFISYGGTAVLFLMTALGLVMSVHSHQ